MQKSNFNSINKQNDIILFLIILFYSVGTVYSQNVSTYSPKINIPSSPEAALLGRFGDIPIGYYTGTAAISVPLYSIKEDGIEIPITLSYHSSGIKVADEATWVGLGWDLSPGGTIIQEVRGKRDEIDMIYRVLPNNYDYLKNIILNQGYTGAYRYLKHRCYQSFDSDNLYNPDNGEGFPFDIKTLVEEGGFQPDIYHFNFGSHSGSFFINYETHEIVQIKKSENIVFQYTSNGISAKTSDGITYQFSITEKSYNIYLEPDEVSKAGRTFKLTSILLVNGNTIDFTYTNSSSINLTFEEKYLIAETCNDSNSQVKGLKHKFVQNDVVILSKITTNDMVIDFILENREDLIPASTTLPNPKRLKNIDIYYKNAPTKKIKTFEFIYSYFPFEDAVGIPHIGSLTTFYNVNKDKLGKRLKLDEVKEIGYDQISGVSDRSKPSYRFEYDMSNIMPMKISFSKDFWGYFNGINNKTLLPDLKYFDYNYDRRYFQPDYIPGTRTKANYMKPFNYSYYEGINRYTDNTKAGAYMLKKIYYPTTGYSEFEYEPNSFTNQFIPDMVELNKALKMTRLLNDSKGQYAVNYHKDFKLANSATLTFRNAITDGFTPFANPNAPVYSYDNFEGSKIVLSKTKQGVKTTIEEWNINSALRVEFESKHGKTWNEDVRIDFDADPTVSYAVDVINTLQYNAVDTYRIANVESAFYYYDNTGINTSISNQCGMRVAAIKNYTAAGNITNRKIIKYSEGKLLNRFQPLSAQETFCEYRSSEAVDGQFLPTASIHNEISISSDNLVNNEGNLIGYGLVEEIEVDKNDQNNGKKIFEFSNYENIDAKNVPTILNPFNGMQSHESVYDKNNKLLYSKSYSYAKCDNSYTLFSGVINVNQLSGLSTSCNNKLYPGLTDFTLIIYPIISNYYKLSNITTTNYFNGNYVKSSEDYTYNIQGEIRTKTETNSNQDKLVTTYYYASDRPELEPIEDIMITAKMTGIPLMIENHKNSEILSKQNTQFAKDSSTNNLILPKYIFSGKGTNGTTFVSSEKKVTFNQYDSKGNIQQYTLENGTSMTILWGYNKTLPIAKIENATFDQVAAALGITSTSLDGYTESSLTSINNLRSNASLANSIITTYTYIPLVGVSTITDGIGDKITYTYDAFGRLQYVKDKNNNILSENQYQYRN